MGEVSVCWRPAEPIAETNMTRSRNISGSDRIADRPRLCYGMGASGGLGGKISPQTKRLYRIRGNPDGEAGVSHRAGGIGTELGTSTAFSIRNGQKRIVCRGMESGQRGMQHGVIARNDARHEGRVTIDSRNTVLSGVGTVTSVIGEGGGLAAATGDYGVRAGGAFNTTFIRHRAGEDVGGRKVRSSAGSGPVSRSLRPGHVARRSVCC